MIAATAQVHGTTWLGVAIAAAGTTLICAGLMRAGRPVAVAGSVLLGYLVVLALAAVLDESDLAAPAIVLGQFGVSVAAGVTLPLDRWRYLTVAGGAMLTWLVGRTILFPQGEQWSADPIALASAVTIAFVCWVPMVAGSAVGAHLAESADRRSVQR